MFSYDSNLIYPDSNHNNQNCPKILKTHMIQPIDDMIQILTLETQFLQPEHIPIQF